MKWELLCLTQPSRWRFLTRLKAVLKPQLEEFPDVTFTVAECSRVHDLGTNRQMMIDASVGEYVNFIDDDDLVPPNYVRKIRPLLDGVDYIGFQLQMFTDGVKQIPTFHSLKYPTWNGDKDGWYRDISHLNPIRRELAIQSPMSGPAGEDCRWAEKLRQLGIVKTEHYVDEVMYLYYWRGNKNDPPENSAFIMPNGQNNQRWQPERSVKCPNCGSTATGLAGGMRQCNQCGDRWA